MPDYPNHPISPMELHLLGLLEEDRWISVPEMLQKDPKIPYGHTHTMLRRLCEKGCAQTRGERMSRQYRASKAGIEVRKLMHKAQRLAREATAEENP